jgi:AraC-like DNA-binding protein
LRSAKSAFSERFREVVGKPPLQYLTEYRIRKACQLLRDTRLGVKEISSQVGYDSASSFSNAFKRWMGKSPGAFRRNGERRTGTPARH